MPTTPRDLAPDVLRGFALLGIALVNVAYFATDAATGATGRWLADAPDALAAFLVWALAQGKFYLLFSFLFGYSAAYVVRDDPARRGLWRARAAALLVLGALHAALLFHGDILFGYGLLALPFAALLFRDAATVRRWAVGVFAATAALQALLVVATWAAERAGEPAAAPLTARLNDVLQGGTYLASVPARVELWVLFFPSGMLLQGGYAFAAFAVGLLAARAGALAAGARALDPRRLMAWGFGLGLPLQVASAWWGVANERSTAYTDAAAVGAVTLGLTTAPLLTAGYVGAVLWLLARAPAAVAWLRFPGRMSLTTYLGQSLVFATVFGPWGFGLFQRLPYWGAVLVAAAVALALSLVARAVIGRWGQGPFEAGMRAWTRRQGGRAA